MGSTGASPYRRLVGTEREDDSVGGRWGKLSERAFDVSGEPLNPVPSRMEEGGEPPKGLGHGREKAGELSTAPCAQSSFGELTPPCLTLSIPRQKFCGLDIVGSRADKQTQGVRILFQFLCPVA